jgi:hypothetical protein
LMSKVKTIFRPKLKTLEIKLQSHTRSCDTSLNLSSKSIIMKMEMIRHLSLLRTIQGLV